MCDLTANPQALQGFVLIVFAAIALVAIALWELHDFLTSDRLRQQSRANQVRWHDWHEWHDNGTPNGEGD